MSYCTPEQFAEQPGLYESELHLHVRQHRQWSGRLGQRRALGRKREDHLHLGRIDAHAFGPLTAEAE